MNYIIFGGSGFIGTHLIKLLKETACANGEQICTEMQKATNICGKKTVENYKFHYTFAESLKDWYEDCAGEGLV